MRTRVKIAREERLRKVQQAGENLWDGTVDQAKLKELANHLDVVLPVQVRPTMGYKTTGCHRFNADQKVHRITVSRAQSVKVANETLRHEMTHAAQAERYMAECDDIHEAVKAFGKDYAREQKRTYKRNKFEVEANLNKDLAVCPIDAITQAPHRRGFQTALDKASEEIARERKERDEQHERELAGIRQRYPGLVQIGS